MFHIPLSVPAFAPEGWRYARILVVIAVLLAVFAPALSIVGLLVAAATVWFHRDPERSPPPTGIVAPADGHVSVIREEGDRVRVAVFMGLTDVHVNRAPAPGTVASVEHVAGRHFPAFSKESERNERVILEFEDYELTLIAGTVARRIHPYVEAGEKLTRGQRVGVVSFGSRADVLLPPEYDPADVRVSAGQHVRAGETVVVH